MVEFGAWSSPVPLAARVLPQGRKMRVRVKGQRSLCVLITLARTKDELESPLLALDF